MTTVKLKDVEPFTEAELFKYTKLYHQSEQNSTAKSTGDVGILRPEDYISRLFATALKGCSEPNPFHDIADWLSDLTPKDMDYVPKEDSDATPEN